MDKKRTIDEETDSSDNLIDVVSEYPSLISVLNKDDGGIACYNLNKLQEELECLLLSLTERHNILLNELSSLQNSLSEREENIKESVNEEPKKSTSEDKVPGASKASSENIQKPSFTVRAKCKMQSSKPQDYDFLLKSDVPKQQKNDTSNRFWSFIDSYCTDVTLDDIMMLENWIESHDKDSEYQDIPTLGAHYSTKWTHDDILEEMKEGSKSVENPKGIRYSPTENGCAEELLNRVKNENFPLDSEQPPLVKNLVSSLVLENIITSTDVMAEPVIENGVPETCVKDSRSRTELNEKNLENRLREQLEEIGVLEKSPTETDDELLVELKQMQALLIPVSRFNLRKKKELLSRAKAEMVKQEAQKRIQEADAKVMESYRAISALRSKGKKISKKEFYQIRTILEERKNLVKNLSVVS